ncbi:unnamed protein product [Phytophthora fragariaefolia]|uniref:Unnamed protein product n=1 Tax=Phytophthora fragariaefolia TaxID=1490495 RepID=A0A9W6YGZ4_9STRA|nr:unnamed protein product [Phytophthora fragariaefolia]
MPNALASGSASEDTDRPIEARARTTGATTTATRREDVDNAVGAARDRGAACGRGTSRSRTASRCDGAGRGRGGAQCDSAATAPNNAPNVCWTHLHGAQSFIPIAWLLIDGMLVC